MFQTYIFAGNLGKDPESRYTPEGQLICTFSVATNHKYKTKDGQQVNQKTWLRVSTYGKVAEACQQYLSKGQKVLVEGHLNSDPETGGPRIWIGQDGKPHANYEVSAQTVRFLSTKEKQEVTSDDPGPFDE